MERDKTVTYLKSILLSKMSPDFAKGGLFLFLGKKLLHEGQMKIGAIHEMSKDPDGFLYLHYSETNPF